MPSAPATGLALAGALRDFWEDGCVARTSEGAAAKTTRLGQRITGKSNHALRSQLGIDRKSVV